MTDRPRFYCYHYHEALDMMSEYIESKLKRPVYGGYLAGTLRSGKRTAAIMSLIQSARMNGHDSYAYLKDVQVATASMDAHLTYAR